jgi:hypothetical protein
MGRGGGGQGPRVGREQPVTGFQFTRECVE